MELFAWRPRGCRPGAGGGRVCRWPVASARWLSLALYLLGSNPLALAQETCETASPVSIGTPFDSNNAGATADGPVGLCGPTGRDVWHTFTPSISGVYTISLCGSAFDTQASVYDECGGSELACNDDACGQQSQIVISLAAGVPYILRVGAVGSGPGGAYRVTITAPPPLPPGNNPCGSGQVLPPNQPITGNNAGATGSDSNGAACGGSLDRTDVWYSFNPSASGLHIVELCTTAFDGVVSVHSSCFNAQVLACGDDDDVNACPPGAGSRAVFNGTAGTPVLVRVAGAEGGFGPFSLAIRTAAVNDACTSATAVTRGFTYTGAVTPALATEGTASCAPSAFDVWHTHLATVSGPHLVSLCGANFDSVLSIHRGCPGTPGSSQIACSDEGCPSGGGVSELVANLEVGEVYLIRIAGRTTGGQTSIGNYSLRIDLSAPTNDSCASPLPLSAGVPVTGITNGATGTDISSCGAGDSRDVWFTFTPDGLGGIYEFNTCGSVVNTTLGLFSNCSTELACSDDEPAFCGSGQPTGSRITRVLSPGVTYLVRVAANSAVDGPFRLVVNRTPPDNDDCSAARVLSPDLPVGGTLTGAAPSGSPTCAGVDNADVFYSFTPASTGFYRISTCGSSAKTTISVYSVCPPAGEIFCSESSDNSCAFPASESTDLTAVLQAGAPYRIRISAAGTSSAFQIVVSPVVPPNDDCFRARSLQVNSFETTSNARAALDPDLSSCGAGDTRDVWFQIIPDATGTYEFLTCGASGPGVGPVDTVLALFDGCGGTEIACNDNSTGTCGGSPALSRVAARLDLGADYLLRASLSAGAEGAFVVGVRYARPANDSCASAQTVTDGVTAFDNLGADSEMVTTTGCGLGFNMVFNDLWFRYVAPADGPVVASTCGSGFDTAIIVTDAGSGCGPGQPALACNNDFDCDSIPTTPDTASRVVFAAAAGRPYFIRIGSVAGERGPGELRISRPNAPQCRCDWNGLDGLTVQDVFSFLVDWFAGRGDFNLNGQSDLGDLFEFLACYLGNPPECR